MLPIYIMNFLFAVSTTIGMTFIPLLVTDHLGLSLLILGFIEGSTEFISNILRLITGNMFDRVKNKKILFILPSIFALFSKITLFYPKTLTIIFSKIIERIANGTFAAPRDAYVGINAKNKGLALGWLSVSKTSGCIIGPLLVSISTLFIGPLKDNIFLIIFLACFINFIGFILSFKIQTTSISTGSISEINNFNLKDLNISLKNLYGLFFLSFLFFLGRFNDGIIMIHLKNEGFPEWFYLATISFFNVIMLLVSPLMGVTTDKNKTIYVLAATIISLLLFNIFFYSISSVSWLCAIMGIVCWGIQRAGAQISFSALIFKNTSPKYYGTAIGIYSLLSGVGTFLSSVISGYIASNMFSNIFIFSGIFSLVTLVMTIKMYSSSLNS